MKSQVKNNGNMEKEGQGSGQRKAQSEADCRRVRNDGSLSK
jgi:hypothetical protein